MRPVCHGYLCEPDDGDDSCFEDEFMTDTHDGNELDSMDPITVTFKIQSNRLFLFISQAVV